MSLWWWWCSNDDDGGGDGNYSDGDNNFGVGGHKSDDSYDDNSCDSVKKILKN